MDDSDNSTTLPRVIRRRLLAGTALATLAWPFQGQAQIAETPNHRSHSDPALLLWEEWKAAALRAAALCRKQQRLEMRLVREVGFPQAAIHLPGSDRVVIISSLGALEDLVGSDPDMAALREEAEAALVAHQDRWNTADDKIGYSAAKREEAEAEDRQQDLIEALAATPASTLAGIAGKLEVVLHEGESGEACTDFPWPHIRSALRDLVRVGQVLEPDVFMPANNRRVSFLRNRQERWARAPKDRAASLGGPHGEG